MKSLVSYYPPSEEIPPELHELLARLDYGVSDPVVGRARVARGLSLNGRAQGAAEAARYFVFLSSEVERAGAVFRSVRISLAIDIPYRWRRIERCYADSRRLLASMVCGCICRPWRDVASLLL